MTTDVFTPEHRARVMAAVRASDTRPERLARSALHRLGYRFRLHDPRLPGRPDLVFASRRCAIFVNGCFWHGHDCARGARLPKSNRAYWEAKIGRNRERDAVVLDRLGRLGWRAHVVWECALRSETWLADAVDFLGPPGPLRAARESLSPTPPDRIT